MTRKSVLFFAILLVLVAISAALPIIYIVHSAGSNWAGVFPQYVTDGFFYLIRMVKGTDLFPFGNNAFFLEHRADFNPTLSVADYLAAIPLKLGLSLTATLIINAVFWNCVSVLLMLLLLQNLGVKNRWRYYLLVPVYLVMYGVLVRPIVLEIVFPFFLFFLVAFLIRLKRSYRYSGPLLSLAIAGTLYIYPFSWQMAFAILGLYFLWLLKNRQWREARAQAVIIISALVIALPALVYIYKIISDPLFTVLITRSGSIKTHLPSVESFNVGRWIITGLILWFLVERFVTKLNDLSHFRRTALFLKITGMGLILLLLSPIVTGRDAVIGNHLSREIFFWLALSTVVILYYVFRENHFSRLQFYKKVLIVVFLIINIVPIVKQFRRSVLQPFQATRSEIIAVQDYSRPIRWLDEHESQPQVVWANGEISTDVLFLSKHYTLFSSPGYFDQYFLTPTELSERYLIAHYFQDITPQFVDQDYNLAFGEAYNNNNRNLQLKSALCRVPGASVLGVCKRLTDSVEILKTQKDSEIEDLITVNTNQVRPHIYEMLKKFHVTYILKDLQKDPDFNAKKIKGSEEVYNDGRFAIYRVMP